MPHPARSLTLIVASTLDHGIGQNGSLPWPMLKSEMAYFARVTQRTIASLPQGTPNAVIMGRKTWESIPKRFRPLKGRINCVISRTLTQAAQESGALGEARGQNSEVTVSSSLEEAIERLDSRGKLLKDGNSTVSASCDSVQCNGIGHIFVIGGGTIYAAALKLKQARHILLTKIKKPHFECDTYFPLDLDSDHAKQLGWRRRGREELENFVGESFGDLGTTRWDGDVEYEFCLYEKIDGPAWEEVKSIN